MLCCVKLSTTLLSLIYVAEGRKRRGRGSAEGGDGGDLDGDAESDGSDGGSDDDRPRKRGRPPASHREKIKGFTDQEVWELYFLEIFSSACKFTMVAIPYLHYTPFNLYTIISAWLNRLIIF